MTFSPDAALTPPPPPATKTLVVVGGTTGVGAATARRFAALKQCARIVIVGRNASRAAQVIAQVKALAGDHVVEVVFVSGDLSTRAGMRKCAADIAAAAPAIDFLVMCQNGVPRCTLTKNVDGDSPEFATQSLSRFVISEHLVTAGMLAPGAVVMSVANPGHSNDDLKIDDLSLFEASKAFRTNWNLFFALSFRDSSVIDAFTIEQNARYPQYKFFHLAPGLVASETFQYDAFPFPMNWLTWLACKSPAAYTPDQLAAVPAYAALFPEDAEKRASGRFMGPTLTALPPGKWAQDADNRRALWAFLETVAAAEDTAVSASG